MQGRGLKMNSAIDVGESFRRYSRWLQSRYDLTGSSTDNPPSKGRRREDILAEYFADNLPEIVGASEGQIIDSQWNASRQCDLILYSRLSPCFRSPDVRLFPADSVLAAIEVKSRLDKEKIKDCVEKIRLIKRMPVRS